MKSSLTTEVDTAVITFPSAAGQAEPVATITTIDSGRSLALPAGAAAVVLVGTAFVLARRRRRLAAA